MYLYVLFVSAFIDLSVRREIEECAYESDMRLLMLESRLSDLLEGSNSWECERCKSRAASVRHHGVLSFGSVVLVHLKRFEFDPHFFQYVKNHRYRCTRILLPVFSAGV